MKDLVQIVGACLTAALLAACGGPNSSLSSVTSQARRAQSQTLYVTNDRYDNSNYGSYSGVNSVTVYAATTGRLTPSQRIYGSNTKLKTPMGIAVDSSGNIYVANSGGRSVTVYAAGATGNAAAIQTISGSKTGLAQPWGLALDPSGNIYVANQNYGSGSYAIAVYAAGANGNVAPIRTISGSATLLSCPAGIALDARTPPNIYVANNSCSGSSAGNYAITVYAGGANGNVAPIQTINGNYTGLSFPVGIAVDGSDNIYVYNWGGTVPSITVYAAGANGNVAPIQTIAGNHTSLYHGGGVALDANGGIHVADHSAGGRFSRPSFSVPYFASGANGDVQPAGVLQGRVTKLQAPEYIFIR
jgi:hypothetical protein